MLATDRSVSLPAATVPALLIGRKIGPVSIPAASSHSRSARAGQATSPRAIAMVAPSPCWSVLLRRIVTRWALLRALERAVGGEMQPGRAADPKPPGIGINAAERQRVRKWWGPVEGPHQHPAANERQTAGPKKFWRPSAPTAAGREGLRYSYVTNDIPISAASCESRAGSPQ
jgi:hypothetical protein